MRLLIVEPEAEGHHMILYTRLLVREAINRNWSVTILTTERGRDHPAFNIIRSDQHSALETIDMREVPRANTGSISLLKGQLKLWGALAEACASNNHFEDFDLIYCVNLDYFEKALALRGSPFGRRPFAGMLMNPKFHLAPLALGPPSRSNRVYRLLFQRLLRLHNLTRLMVIDRSFYEFCLQQRFDNVDKICVVGDVGELALQMPSTLSRHRIDLPLDAFVILVYGSLSRRKGVEQLLKAVEALDVPQVVALVAGKPDTEIAEFLYSDWCRGLQESGKLIVRAEFHDDQSEAAVFGASDLVWLGYTGGSFGSSGVLYQAGSAGLPVISMAEGLVGWTVREFELGVTVNPHDLSEVVNTIDSLRLNKTVLKKLGDNGQRLAKRHTGKAFADTICGCLASSIKD